MKRKLIGLMLLLTLAIGGCGQEVEKVNKTSPESEERQTNTKSVIIYYVDWKTEEIVQNEITIEGELVNIDGNGNRVACLIHGPEQVIILAGMNKIVDDVESGIARVGTHAAPPNAVRLNRKTPCAVLGHCGDCYSEDCMCCQIVVTRRSFHKGRIKVILIGEELGF